jgi:hypothetical protein
MYKYNTQSIMLFYLCATYIALLHHVGSTFNSTTQDCTILLENTQHEQTVDRGLGFVYCARSCFSYRTQ